MKGAIIDNDYHNHIWDGIIMNLKIAEDFFHISTKGSDNPLLSIAATEILHHERMTEVLQNGASLVKGIGLEIGVSFLGLAFFGLVATKQIVMSEYNRVLDLSLDNMTIQLESHGDHAHVCFKITELKWADLPAEGRTAAITSEWKSYFAQTINPLIEATSGAAGLKPAMIWNQYGARNAYMTDYMKGIIPEGPMRQQFEDDFLLLTGMPAETFNLKRNNPFEHTACYIDSPYEAGKQVMMRSACCMYYRREGGEKCYTCPILKEEDRAQLKLKIEASRQEQSA
jgi:ferric iron reductase protein FhuF